MKRHCLSIVLCLLSVFSCSVAQGSLADCLDATCRISTADGGRGTGCAFEQSQGRIFVLTAAHVVGRYRNVRCEFWRQGHRSAPLPGEVIARSESADAAIVSLPINSFGGVLPACIPVAPRGHQLDEGQTVASVGCASGAWATGFKGHVVGYSAGSLCFTPPPANGRSGSALFDARGEKIVGLVFGRSDGERTGYAVTLEDLYRALNFKQTACGWTHSPLPLGRAGMAPSLDAGAAQGAACGPDGCSPGNYILPYRNFQQQREGQRERRLDELDRRLDLRQRVWPTLPPQTAPLAEKAQPQVKAAEEHVKENVREQVAKRVSGLGVGLVLAAAVGVGVFLFYVVGKQ